MSTSVGGFAGAGDYLLPNRVYYHAYFDQYAFDGTCAIFVVPGERLFAIGSGAYAIDTMGGFRRFYIVLGASIPSRIRDGLCSTIFVVGAATGYLVGGLL